MLSHKELIELFNRFDVVEAGRRLVEQIRESQPVRRVGGGGGNTTIRFPSRKMLRTIQAESRTVELPFLIYCEYDPTVFEIWDQPTYLRRSFESLDGKQRSGSHVPDYLVIANDGIRFVECKPTAKLESYAAKYRDLYVRDTLGLWSSPAGVIAAREFGLGYRVWTPDLVSTTFIRNVDFLGDYLYAKGGLAMSVQIEKVVEIVAGRRCVRLDELIKEVGDADPIFSAISQRQVYVDLHGQLLCRPQAAYVCSDEAYTRGITLAQASAVPVELNTVDLGLGAIVHWDQAIHKVISIGEGCYTFQHEKGQIIRLSDADVSTLIRDGTMRCVPRGDNEEEAVRRIMRASVADMNEAIRREKLIQEYDESGLCGDVPARTIRAWKRAWKKAQEIFGHGFLGLLNRSADRGDDTPKMTLDQLRVLELSIDEDFLNVRKTTRKSAHKIYQERCKTEGGPALSYTTYCQHIRRRRAMELEYWRSGKRAAYQLKGPANDGSKELSDLYPTHGDRAWELAHIDHTELDIELVSAFTGKPLGRPYLTMMVDSYTRMVWAFVLSFEQPSSRTLMLVMRECVRRHGRLPSKLVVDHGSEFMGTYFEVLAARQVITKIERGVGESRGGAPMERAFGKNDTQFIHDLLGNTQARKMGRSKSASHEPSAHAVWTPDDFEEVLAEFLYDIQLNTIHLGILEKPADRLARSLAESGARRHTHIPYDRVFYVGTLFTPDRPTRTVKGGTVRFNHVDYTAPEMARVKSKTTLQIKYDPYDIAHIYAFIEHEWIRLTTNHHLVREFTEREIRLAHLEIMALALHAGRDYSKVSELMLKFLSDVRARERTLLAQRRHRQQQEDAGIREPQKSTPGPRRQVRTHSIKSRKVATPE